MYIRKAIPSKPHKNNHRQRQQNRQGSVETHPYGHYTQTQTVDYKQPYKKQKQDQIN